VAEIEEFFNLEFAGAVPDNLKDRYYSQDQIRDYLFMINWAARGAVAAAGQSGPDGGRAIIQGLTVTQGTGDSITLLAGSAVVSGVDVEIPDSFASFPPTKKTVQMSLFIRVASDQPDVPITSATLNGTTINFVKLKHAFTDSKSRDRAKAPGSYFYEQINNWVLTVDSVDPLTDGTEVLLARFIGSAGGTFEFDSLGATDFRINKSRNSLAGDRATSVDESESHDVELMLKDPSFQEAGRWLDGTSFIGSPNNSVYINHPIGLPRVLRFDGNTFIQTATYRRFDGTRHFFRVHRDESYAVVFKARRVGATGDMRIRIGRYNEFKAFVSNIDIGQVNLTTTFEYYVFTIRPQDIFGFSFFTLQIEDTGSPGGTINIFESIQMYRNPSSLPVPVIRELAGATNLFPYPTNQSGSLSFIQLDATDTASVTVLGPTLFTVPLSLLLPFFVKRVLLSTQGTESGGGVILSYVGTAPTILVTDDAVSGSGNITTRKHVIIPVDSYTVAGEARINLGNFASVQINIRFDGVYLD